MYKSLVLCDDLSKGYLQDISDFILEWESESTTIQVDTSGSTGTPKTIILHKKNIKESALATGRFFDFKKGQTILLNLSPKHIAGKLIIVRALVHQMKIKVLPNQENPLLNTTDLTADFGAFVPYQLKAILANQKTNAIYQNIKNVIIGGAPLQPEEEKTLLSLTNNTYATFGMTETITHFALRNCTKKQKFYTCLPGVTINTDSRECLVINKNKISGKIITNDIINKIDENHFYWIGRFDNVINSGGLKFLPEQLERKIAEILPNSRYFFSGRKSMRFGEELVLYVEGEEPNNWKEILGKLNQKLSKYEIPKEVFFIPVFNETKNGKLIRKNY